MNSWITFGLISIISLLAAGVIKMLESALVPISRARVETMAKDDISGSAALLRVVDSKPNHLSLLALIQMVLDTVAAVFALLAAFELIPSRGWAIAAAILAVTLLRFGIVGMNARRAGKLNPYAISLRAAQILTVVYTVLGPLSKLLIWVSNVITPGDEDLENPYATDVELREAVDIAQEQGVVETTERRMIQNIFDLADTHARQVMVPRPDIVWIESEKSAGQAANLLIRSGHSRVPVIGESVDDIVGIIYLKDAIEKTYNRTDSGTGVPVTDLMREPMFLPDSKPLDDLLQEMQQEQTHIAVLVDEYGGIAGLITMEDILEEIVGEIADEYDEDEEAPIEPVDSEELADTTEVEGSTLITDPRDTLAQVAATSRAFRAQARLPLDDLVDYFSDELGFTLEFTEEITDNVETVAGLLSYELGRVPLPGSSVEVSELLFTAEGGRDRRGRIKVRTVLIEVPERLIPEREDTESDERQDHPELSNSGTSRTYRPAPGE